LPEQQESTNAKQGQNDGSITVADHDDEKGKRIGK
jgi:hypothetical protein